MSSHVSTKQHERRTIEEKIAKVREVVRNVTTNDIVLALHTHDLDVEACIRAFCEGGASVALGEWEQRTNRQKGRQAAKKASKLQAPSPLPSSKSSLGDSVGANGTKSPSNTKTSSTANSVVNGHTSVAPSTFGGPLNATDFGVNGSSHVAPTGRPSQVASAVGAAHFNPNNPTGGFSHPPKHSTAVGNSQSKKPHDNGGGDGGKRRRNQHANEAPGPLARAMHIDQTAFNEGISIDAKVHAIHDEATQHLPKYAGEMQLLEHNFQAAINQSEEALGLCFRQLQQCLAEREQQLRAELTQCRNGGVSICAARQAVLAALQGRAASITAHSPRAEVEKWIGEWEAFTREKGAEQELIASGDRLTIDATQLFAAIRHLGQVASLDSKRFTTEKQHGSKAASQLTNGPSKQVQPTGRTTGAQISTSTAEGGEVGKMASNLPNGSQDGGIEKVVKPSSTSHANGTCPSNNKSGIVMHSEALSSEELATLQRQIEETLKAQGIDPSVLADSSLLGSASAPPRRRAPQNGGNNQGGGGAGKHANADSGSRDKRGARDAGHPPPSSAASKNHPHRQAKK